MSKDPMAVESLEALMSSPVLRGVVSRLLAGISKADLEQEIATSLGVPVDDSQVSVNRMNLAGTLRNAGYIVEGGRNGRNKPYKIVGWQKPVEKVPAEQWDGQAKSRLDWVHTHTLLMDGGPMLPVDETVVGHMSRSFPYFRAHEQSWSYLRSYEMAKDVGRWYFSARGGACVILQRFESFPRFRIFNLSMTPVELLDVAMYVAPASMKHVTIQNVTELEAASLKSMDHGGTIVKRMQAMYRVREIAEHPERFLNRRGMEQFRSNARRLEYRDPPTFMTIDHGFRVIDEWRKVNEPKQRQLAIGRDYVAVEMGTSDKIAFYGYRDNDPVCIHILGRLANQPDTVGQIVEKSLNYATQPGGHAGTADWNLVTTCRWLLRMGVEWFNAGTFEGGGDGLAPHKRRFARREDDFTSYVFQTSFLTKEERSG